MTDHNITPPSPERFAYLNTTLAELKRLLNEKDVTQFEGLMIVTNLLIHTFLYVDMTKEEKLENLKRIFERAKEEVLND